MTDKNKDQGKRKAVFPIDALKRGFSVPFFSLFLVLSHIYIYVYALFCKFFFLARMYMCLCFG